MEPPTGEPRSDPARLSTPGIRVLAAEDNEANQQVLAGLADYFGFHVTVLGNGRETLELFQKDGSFHVVLMDCQMPVMDGYRATCAIQKIEQWEKQLPLWGSPSHELGAQS